MEIELKKVKIYLGMSEETTAFTSDLYIDGIKVGYCKNDGHGGNTYYSSYDKKGRELIEECEKYFKTLPKTHCEELNFDFQPTLDGKIDEIIDEISNKKEKEKFEKRMKKDMEIGIVVGNVNSYSVYTWKGITLKDLLLTERGRNSIKSTILTIRSKHQIILNTNIPIELLN